MQLMCEVCNALRTDDHMNRFHSVNVTKLRTKHVIFYTCKDGDYENEKQKDCTSKAKNILTEISELVTQGHPD